MQGLDSWLTNAPEGCDEDCDCEDCLYINAMEKATLCGYNTAESNDCDGDGYINFVSKINRNGCFTFVNEDEQGVPSFAVVNEAYDLTQPVVVCKICYQSYSTWLGKAGDDSPEERSNI